MKQQTSIRIYFEYGQKRKNISFWQKFISADFATEIIKKAKAYNLEQVLNFSVSKGYFKKQKINWGLSETKSPRHPHIIEITDTEKNIEKFLENEKELLAETTILIVKNEVVIKAFRS